MNKQIKKLPLFGLLVCLASCGNTSVEAGAVKKGKAIPVAEVKEKMQDASKAMESKDAFSIHMDDATYHYSMEMEKNVPTGSETSTSFKMNQNTKLDKINVGLGFTGLTSTEVSDVKGYGEIKSDVDIHGSTTSAHIDNNYQTPKGSVGFTYYQNGNTSYLDLSDNKLQSVISTVEKNGLFDNNLKFNLSSNKKIAFDNGLENEDMPVLSEKEMNHISYEISEKIEDIASKGGTVKALQHDDGTYSYSVETKNLENAVDFEDMIDDDFHIDVDDDYGYNNIKPTITSKVTVNNYSISYIFDQNGIQSIGATIDVSYTFHSALTINNSTFSTDITMNYYFNGKLNFDYDSKVNIKEVQDPDTYQVVKID